MPSLSYKSRLVAAVADGSKPHSIRAWRQRPFRVGDPLMHYTAMRTKACRKIRANTVCTAAVTITVDAKREYVLLGAGSRFYKRGRLNIDALRALAARDGFEHLVDFWSFFKTAPNGRLYGQLVEWTP